MGNYFQFPRVIGCMTFDLQEMLPLYAAVTESHAPRWWHVHICLHCQLPCPKNINVMGNALKCATEEPLEARRLQCQMQGWSFQGGFKKHLQVSSSVVCTWTEYVKSQHGWVDFVPPAEKIMSYCSISLSAWRQMGRRSWSKWPVHHPSSQVYETCHQQ